MSFFETEFPRCVSFKATGGPTFNTTVNAGFSGYEQRNKNWSLTRAKWNVNLLTPPKSQFSGTQQQFIDLVHSFFLVVGGKADAFRFFDHKDNKIVGQTIGVGDGVNKVFQLVKTYSIGGRSYSRTITKPIMATIKDYQGNNLTDTVKIYYGGVLQVFASPFIDTATGIVTIPVANAAPGAGVIVTADFSFHYPVRFDTDEFSMQIEDSDVQGGNTIITTGVLPLIEVRL